jgi:hypothetical protein
MSTSRMKGALIALVLGWSLAAASAGADPASTTISIEAGKAKEVCAGIKADVAAAPKYGTLSKTGDAAKNEPILVVYKAAEADKSVSETLVCKVGDQEKPVKVDIVPRGRNNATGFSDDVYPEAFKALFLLFVVATVLESALALLFNWRPFVETFNARAVRPVVSFIVSLIVVFTWKLDIMTGLAKLISAQVPELDWTGKILTAMVLAGGSAAINNLMVTLGFRQVRTPENSTPKPPLDKGWISVSILRKDQITGPVTVRIGVADGHGNVPVVASLNASTNPVVRYFLRDRGRFPGSGGFAVQKGEVVSVKVSAKDSIDTNPEVKYEWGPEIMGEGAIIDLTFTMKRK